MFRNRGPEVWGLICCFLISFQIFGDAESFALRNAHTPCGIYLSTRSNDTIGTVLTKNMDAENLKRSLEAQKLDPKSDKLVAVGVPYERQRRKNIESEIRKTLTDMGYRDVPVSSVRRLSSFISDRVGVFSVSSTGELKRISSLDPQEIRSQLSQVPDQTNLVVVGEPLFGAQRTAIRDAIGSDFNVKYEKAPITTLKKTLGHPVQAIKHMTYGVRSVFPVPEDWQRPTRDEIQQMGQKLIIPGIITFSVLLGRGEPLEILIPVTMTNAFNSALTGTFRTTMGNWWSRSKSFFPSLISKQLLMGTFFTGTLYLAKQGNLDNLMETLTLAGWINFMTSQWLTVVFNALWRTPVHAAIFKWERWMVQKDTTVATNVKARAMGASIEKYMSYVMSQFFIYSVMAQESFFKIVASDGGITAVTSAPAPDMQVLMSFNTGHLAMLSVGLFSALAIKNVHWLGPIGKGAFVLNGFESKIWTIFKKEK